LDSSIDAEHDASLQLDDTLFIMHATPRDGGVFDAQPPDSLCAAPFIDYYVYLWIHRQSDGGLSWSVLCAPDDIGTPRGPSEGPVVELTPNHFSFWEVPADLRQDIACQGSVTGREGHRIGTFDVSGDRIVGQWTDEVVYQPPIGGAGLTCDVGLRVDFEATPAPRM
jgi:hypothetical protein